MQHRVGDRRSRLIFRRKTVQAQTPRAFGEVAIAVPPPRWSLSGLAAALASIFPLFLSLVHLIRRESATGQPVPSASFPGVAASDAKTIPRLGVRSVKAVRVLSGLFSEQGDIDVGNTRTVLGLRLDTQRGRLRADLESQSLSWGQPVLPRADERSLCSGNGSRRHRDVTAIKRIDRTGLKGPAVVV
jgi:hypothetical protein